MPCNYNPRKPFHPENAQKNTEVVFENQIKPNQAFNVSLLLNSNSLKGKDDKGYDIFQWEIEIVSQIVITKKTEVVYDFMIGDDLHFMKKLGQSIIQQTLTSLETK